MVDYSDSASKFIERRYNNEIEELGKTKGGIENISKESLEIANNYKEHLTKVSQSVLKVMTENGPDLFDNYHDAEKKILQQCVKDGIYQKSGNYFEATTPNGGMYREHAYSLVGMACYIAQTKGLDEYEALKNDKLNTKSNIIADDFRYDFYSANGGFQQAKIAMQFAEKVENNQVKNTYNENNIDLTVKVSEETKGKSTLNESEFKTMIADRVQDIDKIKQYQNDENQRYYGNGLMAHKDKSTNEITYSVDGQQVDSETFHSLHLMYRNSQKEDKLVAGVKQGSLIILYDPYKKENGEYKNVKYLTQQSDGNIVALSKEEAEKIKKQEQSAGIDTKTEKLHVENYGGGLITLQNKDSNKLFLNTNNISHSTTGKSRTLVHDNLVSKFKNAGRG